MDRVYVIIMADGKRHIMETKEKAVKTLHEIYEKLFEANKSHLSSDNLLEWVPSLRIQCKMQNEQTDFPSGQVTLEFDYNDNGTDRHFLNKWELVSV